MILTRLMIILKWLRTLDKYPAECTAPMKMRDQVIIVRIRNWNLRNCWTNEFKRKFTQNSWCIRADHTEDVLFNTFPAAFMPDFGIIKIYLTRPNMILNDDKNHSPEFKTTDHSYLWIRSVQNAVSIITDKDCRTLLKICGWQHTIMELPRCFIRLIRLRQKLETEMK